MGFTGIIGMCCLMLLVSGCSSWAFWKSDEPEATAEPAASAPAPEAKGSLKPKSVDEHELKLAKLWARIDELEEEQYRQKERVRVLEKGLTLGLVPEELKGGKPPAKTEKPEKPEPPVEVKPAESPKPAEGALSKEDEVKYQAMLAKAHDYYRAGRYGQAVAEFDRIGEAFGGKAGGGMHRYWIARCWIELKEYNTARQQLQEFLKDSPGSPWAPRAKLELGRAEWRAGLGETAVQRYRDLIQEHPFDDAAEMAKMELEHLGKTL